ncbi:cytochrome P450 [Rhypophila decipiens]|uniref:Cytochrome P450 n=1 Tax=Rhypophila decipiens TaxID=261697 RepID=A0AAN7B8S4_9PEZI|nr:cytochrome P450 [Rhypophila decipiens]
MAGFGVGSDLILYLSPVLVLSLLVRRLVHFFNDKKLIKQHGCKPPMNIAPLWDPILGIDLVLQFIRAAREGRYIRFSGGRLISYDYATYVIKRLALPDTIYTAEPENIKHILATEFKNFGLAELRINAMFPLFGSSIFTTNGPAWAHSRALLRPSFTRSNMAPLHKMMERHFQLLLNHIPRDKSFFDLQQPFFCFTMDTATEFLMGKSTHTLDSTRHSEAERHFVQDYLNCCYEAVLKIVLGKLQIFRYSRTASKARDRAWAYVDGFAEHALASREARKVKGESAIEDEGDDSAEYNFLEEMTAQTNSRAELRSEVLGVLLASRDTTAALLSNLFYALSRRPHIYAKLRTEVLSRIKGPLPTEEELNNMTYLRWCINETLRFHPVVPGNTREALCDTTIPLGGGPDGKSPLFVKKGTPVIYNLHAIHRRPDIYGDDSHEFRPERWDGLRPGWGFIPFNGGPRICLGQQFALSEASFVIARMLQCFESIETNDSSDWLESYSLVMCSKKGVSVSLTPDKEHLGW